VANTIGGIAVGGVFHRPHVAFQEQLRALGVNPPDISPHDFPLSDDTIAALKSGMWAVVNEGGGTGGLARCPGIDISGKTGTAQVVSQALEKSTNSSEFKSTAWFVGYAPSDRPEIVVAALVMRGEHSIAAVPIARDVIKAYFDKKLGPKPPDNQMETQVRVLSQLRLAALPEPPKPAARQ
jgi:penicillin-binding protein 2